MHIYTARFEGRDETPLYEGRSKKEAKLALRRALGRLILIETRAHGGGGLCPPRNACWVQVYTGSCGRRGTLMGIALC